MLDWLRRDQLEPTVRVNGVALPIAIRRHPTAKRVVLRIAPDGSEARVTLPRWGRTADAIEFAHSRADWLAGQLAALPKPAAPIAGGLLRYCGENVTIEWQAGAKRRPILGEGRLVIGGPEENLAPRLQRWLEREALQLLENDLQDYCAAAGVPAPAIRLSRAQRRWGSCSSSGTVRVNWRLVQAPHFVRRSVVAHEVAHLLHFDHGPAFHAALDRIYNGDLAAANAWLKREGRTLYAAFG
ncbi:MAG: SprT family zinc-dependent metalloprotease [Allopontixanthobacter sediminis]